MSDTDPKFDLMSLFKLGELDIRSVARNNLTMPVKEYYKLLAKFLRHTPMAIDSLQKIANQKAAEYDFRGLADIKENLEDIGCDKHSITINEIMSSGKMGHIVFAADSAKTFLIFLLKLQTGINAAKKPEESESEYDDSSSVFPEEIKFEDQSLRKVLQILEQKESHRKMRILAVDDSSVMLKTISSVLGEKYKVYGMTDPTMLEIFLKKIVPELFLLDYRMPSRSGFDLIPIIRSFEEHKETPIIFLTSIGTLSHVSSAFALGACDYIVKPFKEDILLEKIAKHIIRKKLF